MLEEFQVEFNWNNGRIWAVDSANASIKELMAAANKNLEKEAVTYVAGQWFTSFHQYFVRAWVDQHFNGIFGAASRLEGTHHVLKNWIRAPTKDLTRVWQSIQLEITSQLNENNAMKHRQAQVAPASLSG